MHLHIPLYTHDLVAIQRHLDPMDLLRRKSVKGGMGVKQPEDISVTAIKHKFIQNTLFKKEQGV